MRDISSKIRLRFPTMRSLVEAGLLTDKESNQLEIVYDNCPNLRWMTPLHWVQQLLRREEEESKPTTSLLNHCITELKLYRQSLRKLFCHDWVCVPLVYTQVAALATYAFFFFALFGRQPLIPDIQNQKELDLVIPVFTIVQFLFFVGWFKVGQDLMRPFGLDDDDIELNYILDRNIATCFAIVHSLQGATCPEFEEDPFWQNKEGRTPHVPHTPQSKTLVQHRPKLHVYVKLDEDNGTDCLGMAKQKKHIDW